MMSRIQSEALFAEALNYIPGGVNSPVRAFRAVGGKPFFVNKARGSRVRDVDGNEYVDYVCTWGPAILGHANPAVVAAVREALADGFALGATSPREVALGMAIRAAVPSMERQRFTSSGTEASLR